MGREWNLEAFRQACSMLANNQCKHKQHQYNPNNNNINNNININLTLSDYLDIKNKLTN